PPPAIAWPRDRTAAPPDSRDMRPRGTGRAQDRPGRGRATLRATSGLARRVVLVRPAGPGGPPLPARAARRLGPARSSAGGWPRRTLGGRLEPGHRRDAP